MRLTQGRTELELHELAPGKGRALLLLHALYGSSADWGEGAAAWSGPVYGLDFVGHGRSQWNKGGAYTPELLGCNVDEALRQIGPASLVGAGVGAYVALLIAGARPELVPAALLLPGAGLEGYGPVPDFTRAFRSIADLAAPREGCDRMLAFLDNDVRPLDYVAPFARRAKRLVLLEDGGARPEWWATVRGVEGVRAVDSVRAGLAAL